MATEVWKFQDGTPRDDVLNDAAVGPNNTVVLVGTTNGSWDSPNAGGEDMAVIKLDIDGNILWTWQNGTSMNDHAQSVVVAEDGSITVGGYRETETESAFVVAKLDGDGDLLWQWEGGTGSADVGSALAMWEDGSIVLAGQTEGDWNGTNLGSIDFAAFKLKEDGTLQWKFQDGTNRTEYFTGAAVGEDGSVVLAGSSAGNWDGLKYGPLDFVAIKIDSWGAESWRWQGGSEQSDFARDVAIGDDGSVFLAGFTFGDWSNVKSGGSDFAVVKLSTDGNELWRWQFGVHMQVLNKCMFGPDLRGDPYLQPGRPKRSELDSSSTSLWDARRMRRQRNLDKIEIPELDVMITDELLGKGGFGAVYMADYNGRNVAVKVVQVEHDLRRPNGVTGEMSSGTKNLGKPNSHEDSGCRLFWRELRAMIRLRSPHTVNVFGAITSREDRLVLVMELLPGGDLHALLKGAAEPLSEERARQLIGDICAGMYFLHQKETVHGDLKSPNVLLDGDGRAKIADFGTSKWLQLTNSTGLVTTTTEANQNTQMSYAWASPEVLDTKGSSYASDVYSFGVVVWEVLTRETPWAGVCLRDIYVHMVIKEDRLNIPAESPADLTIIISACWARVPEKRPTFSKITRWLSWE